MFPLDIFTKQFNLSGLVLIASVAIFSLAVIILLVNVVILNRKLKKATTPTYGFAGKPIYPIIATLLISVSIPLAVYSLSQETTFEQKAEENVILQSSHYVVSRDGENLRLEFNVVPYVDGVAWGEKSFDIFWSFKGKTSKTSYEFNKSAINPSKMTITLPKGEYDLTILVTYENRSQRLEQKLVLK
ncbi:hypothetical protein JW796_03255 [Candidatus Dojkabacteria bacterium]|nr:hypothetical protein [Candidatus Dojkabacteria bacterium]